MQNQKQTTKPATKPATRKNVAQLASAKNETLTPAELARKFPETTKARKEAEAAAKETAAAVARNMPEAKTAFYPALLAACLAGKFGTMAKAYYHRAGTYHKKAGTVFPRPRNAGTIDAMLGEGREKANAKAQEIVKRAASGILAAGDAEGQALYDMMRAGMDLPAK